MSASFRAGLWRLADPKISLASMASMFLGSFAAAADGPLHLKWLALTVLGIFAIEVAKNASGELFDFDSGTDRAVADRDRSPFSGGKRVLVDGLLTRAEVIGIAVSGYAIGVASGLLIVAWREPRVLWLGIAGIAAAYFYHAPPLKLSYRGFGELAVALSYGPLVCCGTYLVQRNDVPTRVLALSLPLGVLIGAFLWINEFPDFEADRASGKKTLVVRLGRKRASVVFVWILGVAGGLFLLLPAMGFPKGVWLAALAFLPAAVAGRRLKAFPEDTARIVPAQALTLLSFVLFALGGGLGLLLVRW